MTGCHGRRGARGECGEVCGAARSLHRVRIDRTSRWRLELLIDGAETLIGMPLFHPPRHIVEGHRSTRRQRVRPGQGETMTSLRRNPGASNEISNIAGPMAPAALSSFAEIGDRLMVGQQPLELLIKVRILVPEPTLSFRMDA